MREFVFARHSARILPVSWRVRFSRCQPTKTANLFKLTSKAFDVGMHIGRSRRME